MKQAKIFPIFIVIFVLLLVGYVGFFKLDLGGTSGSGTAGKSRDILTYVPDDTLFFIGGLNPVPFKEVSSVIAPQAALLKNADWSQDLSDEAISKLPPAALIITGLIAKDFQYLQQPDAAAKFGVGETIDAVSYSVGIIPVMRIKLADEAAFNKYIDEVEQYAKTKPEQKAVAGVNFRSYSFDAPNDAKPSGVSLLIGVNNGYGIVTISSSVASADAQGIIAGTTKPAKSLAASNLLTDIQTKHNFLPSYLGYVNHRELVNGITGINTNEFSRMLDKIIAMARESKTPDGVGDPGTQPPSTESPTSADNKNPLDAVRTDACRKELTEFSNTWPQTVFGYTRLDLAATPHIMESRMLVENTDTAFMQDMQTIRGFIPATIHDVKQQPVFGLGLGINVDAVSPFIAKAIQSFTAKEYQCELLMQVKQSLQESNPAMALGMMSGMAAGLQGLSVAVMDIDGAMPTQPGMPPDIKSLDAIITISSANPQQLLAMLANFQPGMPPIQLPADGTAIDLPIPLPLPDGATVKMALKGNHIVAYTGAKATQMAELLAKQPLQPNGLFAFNMNFGRYMKMLATLAQSQTPTTATAEQKPALTEKEKAMFEEMAKVKMQFVESFDIDKNGMAFDVKMMMD